uniref:Uncharacterized protein n=1 Tax=Trieres chinensis TaxID=1514140 RepID=A0A7S1ZBU2_TRICV|mmetsp:Transcript_21942/g.44400  ORF Transcript_21942/g.44400 Transcript_21942/m.44400 type:complete len:249 (+) Transcript_21942:49-795(+)
MRRTWAALTLFFLKASILLVSMTLFIFPSSVIRDEMNDVESDTKAALASSAASIIIENESTKAFFEELDEKCEAAIKRLEQLGINLIALDFDLTIIDDHTGGRWKEGARRLSTHVRPMFKRLLKAATMRDTKGLKTAVVTFSSQEALISNVMNQILPIAHIPVYGGIDKPKKGKLTHLEQAIEDISKDPSRRKRVLVSKITTVLIDDDEKNIFLARKNGYNAIIFDPERPMLLLEELTSLNLTDPASL